jgi:cell division protein FtsN
MAPATPAVAAAAALEPAADRPTWVKSERYLPDGTRTDTPRPAAGPAGQLPGEGEARKPVLAAVGPAAAMPDEAHGKKGNASPTPAKAPAPASTPAEPPQGALTGYFAQVKSDQNRKAAEAELTAVADKYKGVLGQMQLITRSADLKDRGIWFRVLIGPVRSHDDADNLCKRLKGAGLQDCIVQKLD